jgi:hypothetical protein
MVWNFLKKAFKGVDKKEKKFATEMPTPIEKPKPKVKKKYAYAHIAVGSRKLSRRCNRYVLNTFYYRASHWNKKAKCKLILDTNTPRWIRRKKLERILARFREQRKANLRAWLTLKKGNTDDRN